MKPKLGNRIMIISDNDSYTKYRKKTWIISHIAYSTKDHPGYDEGINSPDKPREALVDCMGLPFSIYEYEFKIIR